MPLFHSACLGIGYGLLLNNRPLIQINTVAAFCVVIYLLSFVYVSQSKVGQDFGTKHMSHNIAKRLRAKFWADCAIPDTSMKFGTVVDHDQLNWIGYRTTLGDAYCACAEHFSD